MLAGMLWSRAVAGIGLLVAALAVASSAKASAATAEMDIVDEYLSQFDKVATYEDTQASMVQDRCHRTGGPEQGATLPQGGGTAATNGLMFQHVEWHGERGRFMEPAFTWSDSDSYGQDFIEFHAALISTFEDWRVLHGYGPLEPWDPMTPIPEAFDYPVGPPCEARINEDPRIALPTFLTVKGGNETSPFWEYQSLCEFPDANRLGKTMEASQYHAAVHNTVGGDMEAAGLTLRDPVFWAWHSFLEGVHTEWQACGQQAMEDATASETAERSTPSVNFPLVVVAIGFVALVRRQSA